MEAEKIITSIISLLFVICLIAIVAAILKRIQEKGFTRINFSKNNPDKKFDSNPIKIISELRLDIKRRIVAVTYKNEEYLLLLSNDNELLLNRNIAAEKSSLVKKISSGKVAKNVR